MLYLLVKKSPVFLTLCINIQLLSSCRDSNAPKSPPQPQEVIIPHIDPSLQPYLDSYLADAKNHGIPVSESRISELVSVVWVDQIVSNENKEDGALLGHCQRRKLSSIESRKNIRKIEVLRPDSQLKVGSTHLDEITLKSIMYHELGHCLHDFDGHLQSDEAAIMNSKLQGARYFDMTGLIDEHFQMLKQRSIVSTQ